MHAKNTVRYYLLLAILLSFLFFTNDFGLTDVQKTALVIAVGLDREEDEFIVTSQIALPKSEKDGENATSAQIVSKGKTVAEAFEQINAKTGWYPKLVFCQLIVLGESATKQNVFEALNFFVRDEYLSDGCLIAACDSSAQEILNVQNPVEALSGLAASKVLSAHSERVGSVLPTSLREFAAAYYGEDSSGYLPILKAEPPQEKNAQNKKSGGQGRDKQGSQGKSGSESGNGGNGGNGGTSGKSGSGSGQQKSGEEEKKVFSASETALFKNGVRIGKLTAEESKTFSFVQSKLRLAAYTVELDGVEYTLNVKHNATKTKLSLKDSDRPKFEISITVTAGILDGSNAEDLQEISDMGEIPDGVLKTAEEKLKNSLISLFNKTKETNCDVFDCVQTLKRKEYDEYFTQKDELLQKIEPVVEIKFRNVR